MFATFSPDGGRVAYQSNETGREEVYVAAFPTFRARGAIRIAMPRWTGFHAVRHVPGAECGRIAIGQGARTLVLALLERAVRLLRCRLAADRQAAGLARATGPVKR